jgi:hypothetical protein
MRIRVISDAQLATCVQFLLIRKVTAGKQCARIIAMSMYFNFIYGLSGIPYDKLNTGAALPMAYYVSSKK